MKTCVWLMIILAVLFSLLPVQNQGVETSLGGEFWSRWTLESGKSPVNDDTIIKKNYFALERGYFDLRTTFTENTKARFTVDIFSTDLIKDGAGLKLKYAFVDFANLVPVPDLTLSAGLQKVYFGTIYDWDYTLIGKAPSDEYKLANSADYGVSFNGYLPAGWGEYALGLYNGEGYKNFGDNLKKNIRMEYLANLRLTPIPGVTIGGSYMSNSVERENNLTDDTPNPAYQQQQLLDGVARLAYGPVNVWVEYLYKDVTFPNAAANDYTATGFMVMPVFSLYPLIGTDIQLVGRYDRWDESDNPADKKLLNAVTGGINFNTLHNDSFVPALQVQLNVTQKTYDADNSAAAYANQKKDALQAMLQLKWRFSSKIK